MTERTWAEGSWGGEGTWENGGLRVPVVAVVILTPLIATTAKPQPLIDANAALHRE